MQEKASTQGSTNSPISSLSRRNFLRSSLIAGTSAAVVRSAWAQEPSDKLQVAIIGCGIQGDTLSKAINAIQDPAQQVRVRALCDINERGASKVARTQPEGTNPSIYSSAEEMLEKEGDQIDAVIVATPDFAHHHHSIMAMEAGCDVYCEKLMSNRISTARDIVLASQEQNSRHGRRRICQIGHQRRSNPRYLAAKQQLIDELDVFGPIITSYAQWNRSLSSSLPKAVPTGRRRRALPSDKVLRDHGFTGGKIEGSPEDYSPLYHYLNWRSLKAYGAGIASDLGAHQIDLFSWFLNALPSSLTAQGGVNFFNQETYGFSELPDTIQAGYSFEKDGQKSNCLYQVATHNASQESHEVWLGTNGTLVLGEDARKWNTVYRDLTIKDNFPTLANEPAWQQAFERQLMGDLPQWRNFWDAPTKRADNRPAWQVQGGGSFVDARVSAAPAEYALTTSFTTPPHEPHLRNFFSAVRNNNPAEINCPAEDGFVTTVIVLKIYEALANGGAAPFDPQEFIARPGTVQEYGELANSPTFYQTTSNASTNNVSEPNPTESTPAQINTQPEASTPNTSAPNQTTPNPTSTPEAASSSTTTTSPAPSSTPPATNPPTPNTPPANSNADSSLLWFD